MAFVINNTGRLVALPKRNGRSRTNGTREGAGALVADDVAGLAGCDGATIAHVEADVAWSPEDVAWERAA
jgi:hypothetical protein